MKKDYHKGVRLQVYIPEELNEKINNTIERSNLSREIFNCNEKYTKTDLVKESLEHYIQKLDDIYN